MPLGEIVDELREIGFSVTTSQLEYRLSKKWKFVKNIRRDTWVEIDHCIGKRKREGKDSEVIFCGKRVKQETVERETSRHRDRSIFARLAPQPISSPVIAADTQISVCTPQPLPMEFGWPSTLPWLKFPAKDLQMILSTYMVKTSDSEAIRLGALIPANFLGESTNVSKSRVSKLAAIIGASMPESFSQENIQRAQCLLNESREESLYESLSLVIYGLSNNLSNLSEEDNWQAAMTILKTCGLFQISVNLKDLNSWTIDGFMEKLFYAAIDRLYEDYTDHREIAAVLKWLLTLGHHPVIADKRFWACFGSWGSSEFAVMERYSLELLRYLLEAGGDANCMLILDCPRSKPQTILEIVLGSDCGDEMAFRMAKLLLEYGASVHLDRALHSAIRRGDRRLVEMILENGGDLSAEVEYPYGLVSKTTALSVAAATGLLETQYILDLLGSRSPSKPIAEFITADVLISAVIKGRYDTTSFFVQQIRHYFLITQGADVDAVAGLHTYNNKRTANRLLYEFGRKSLYNVYGLTPLDIVLKEYSGGYMTQSCATMLINAGAKPSGSTVVFAAHLSCLDLDLLSVALAAGADPNGKDAMGKSALQLALHQRPRKTSESLRHFVALLLQYGAMLFGGEVVSAIRFGDWDLVHLLLNYGGTLLDTDRFETTVLEAAIPSLEAAGLTLLFETVLSICIYDAGSLCAAIATRQTSIVQQLLINRRTKPVDHVLEVTAIGMAAELAANSGDFGLLRNLLDYPPSQKVGPTLLRRQRGPWFLNFVRKACYNSAECAFSLWGSPLALIVERGTDWAIEACSELLRNGFQADRLTWALASRSNNLAVVQCLLDYNQRYEEYENGNRESVALLLRAGVDVNEDTTWIPYSRSPLQLAVELGNLEMVRYLIDAGANINAPPAWEFGATALQFAAIKGYLGIAKYLLDLGADVNALPAGDGGRTALEGAAEWGRLDMLELLLAHGAETTGDWRYNFVGAVRLAIWHDHYTAANFLKQSRGWSEEDENLFGTIDIGNFEKWVHIDE
ncbi:hypothetical protein O1611_g5162 [Lasiodiplodia mahajangana]|uniref:Uncharacterized protein n=1 Tax=Lasiodiplodia mahajangana TaxID=1108764 RepID=A0ACC2JMK9_9PEZI|nr:hypothetical protein O1611_g5162 [Lasiodiplodia mahajangana]